VLTVAIVVALAIVHAHNPRRPVPDSFNLQELFLPGVSLEFQKSETAISWRNTFLFLDRLLKLWEEHGSRRVREKAIRAAERWMIDRFEASDGLGAIYPPMMYAIMALDVLGYAEDHPLRQEAVRQFEGLIVNDGALKVVDVAAELFHPFFDVLYNVGFTAADATVVDGVGPFVVSREQPTGVETALQAGLKSVGTGMVEGAAIVDGGEV